MILAENTTPKFITNENMKTGSPEKNIQKDSKMKNLNTERRPNQSKTDNSNSLSASGYPLQDITNRVVQGSQNKNSIQKRNERKIPHLSDKIMAIILQFLPRICQFRLQVLNRYYYDVFIPNLPTVCAKINLFELLKDQKQIQSIHFDHLNANQLLKILANEFKQFRPSYHVKAVKMDGNAITEGQGVN